MERTFDEVETISKQQWKTLPTVRFVATSTPVADLFKAALPETMPVTRGIIWTALDGLRWLLRDPPARSRILQRFRRMSHHRQWFAHGVAWNGATEVLAELSALGLILLQSSEEQRFLAEVERPDQEFVAGFVGCELGLPAPGAVSANPKPLIRAPYLRRRLYETPTPKLFPKLYEELTSRPYRLLFFCDPSGLAPHMKWPGVGGTLLPVYSDMESWSRAAQETGQSSTMCVGDIAATELFAWARESHFGVAFGFYPADTNSIRYLLVDPKTLEILSWQMPTATGGWTRLKRWLRS